MTCYGVEEHLVDFNHSNSKHDPPLEISTDFSWQLSDLRCLVWAGCQLWNPECISHKLGDLSSRNNWILREKESWLLRSQTEGLGVVADKPSRSDLKHILGGEARSKGASCLWGWCTNQWTSILPVWRFGTCNLSGCFCWHKTTGPCLCNFEGSTLHITGLILVKRLQQLKQFHNQNHKTSW